MRVKFFGRLSQHSSLTTDMAAVALLVIIFLVRFHALDADPPSDLSASTDVYTDPSHYTLYARSYVQTGQWNPVGDNRYVFFENSVVTALSAGVFKLLGVSTWSANLVGLLLSMGALLLFYLFIRRVAGVAAGFFYLILIGLNYNQLFYGRLPFLEHAMTFFAFLALVLVVHSRSFFAAALAGVFLGVGIFFGKIIGVVFVFPFLCLFLYRFFSEGRNRTASGPAFFTLGLAMVAIVWLFVSYLPMRQEVVAYLGEHTMWLYGPPEGFESLNDFIWKLVSFGDRSKLIERMWLPVILAAVFIGAVLHSLTRRDPVGSGNHSFNAGHVFIAAMIVAFYGSLMIWNYRPLRYQLALIYPICGAAAIILSRLWSFRKTEQKGKASYALLALSYPLALVLTYKLMHLWFRASGRGYTYEDYGLVAAGGALVITVVLFALMRLYATDKFFLPPVVARLIVVAAAAFTLGWGVRMYAEWLDKITFTARDSSRDLATFLSEDAVLSGPFAAELAMENNLKTVTHMFGVSNPDSALFDKFPITHLLVDYGNERRARTDYPAVMDSAVFLKTYYIAEQKAHLYRIAEGSDNPKAAAYQPTGLEDYLGRRAGGEEISFDRVAAQIGEGNNPGMTVCLLLAETAESENRTEEAQLWFKKAVEFSPTNYHLIARLADFYRDRYTESTDKEYKDKALSCYSKALQLAPKAGEIYREYKRLRGNQVVDPEEP